MKLSKLQLKFLQWLAKSNTFEICKTPGDCYGKTNGLHYFNGRYCIRTLNKLTQENLIFSKPVYYYGIKWHKYFVSDNGYRLINSLSRGSKHA